MIPLQMREIAEIVGGVLHDAAADTLVTGPAFLDTRTPERDGLFAAFEGEHVDGHAFAAGAVAGGAVAVLGSRPTGQPTIVVPDVQAALQRLAQEVLRRRRAEPEPITVIAITGSQGKTSAKDMLAAVLESAGPTVATRGSFNNELGLPLTVLRADAHTRFLVLEMGARGIGHLAELCAIAPPDISLVLNVGRAHLGEFGSRENIARAKGELVEALAADGAAVLNADDPLVAAMSERTSARVWRFGTDPTADVRLAGVDTDELGRPGFELSHDDVSVHVGLQLLGEHQAGNAAAVAATALAAGLRLEEVAGALGGLTALSRWRMELAERDDGLVVINDAYNANPDSMRAALETLAAIGARSGRATVAVLGEMRELGQESEAEHAALGALVRELGIDRLFVVGTGARAIHEAVTGDTTAYFDSVEEVADAVRKNVVGTEVVLIKASRGVRLERVAEALLAEEASP